MKILFLCDSLIGRGAEKLLNDLLPMFAGGGYYNCELLILTDENAKYFDELTNNGIAIHVIPKNIKNHFYRIKYIKKYILNGDYDIVHANLFPITYYCSISKKLAGNKFPKLVMTEHNTDNKRRHIKPLRAIEKWIYKSYDEIISISKETNDSLISWLQAKEECNKFHVVNNGIHIKKFLEAKEYAKDTVVEGVKDTDVLIGMVGAFTRPKNHKKAIEIIKKLPERYKLVLIGEGELEKEIRQLVYSSELNGRVYFLGFRSDIPQLMKTMDIMIIPSEWEGFGLIAVEGMACGKPIVASDVDGLAEVVGDGGIKAITVDEFVEAILSLEDKEVYQEFQKRAYIQAKKFDISNTKEQYEEIYNQLLAEK